MLDKKGLGFSRRGSDPGSGEKYFSWWNPSTARYFPQSYLLPSLDHVGLNGLRATLNSEYNTLNNRMKNGTGNGSYPIVVGVLGWAHPFGIAYGGMTGGDEIHLWEGIRTVAAASLEGYRQLEITHRMHSDRQPDVVYSKDGDPTRVEDWLKGPANNKHVEMDFFMEVIGSSKDPFNYSSEPTFQVNAVAAQNRKPSYENTLLNYAFHDSQHLVRYTRSPKALVWIGNDQLARDDIEMQAEIARLTYHQYPNNGGGGLQCTGMAFDIDAAQTSPGVGFDVGRHEGWIIDCVNAAYATGDDTYRAALKPWYDSVRDLFSMGQSSCSGFLQSVIHGQFLGGLYRARNNIEQAIAENALQGAIETVYRLEDPASVAMIEDVLEKSFYSWFNIMAWATNKNGPFAKAAVGPLNLNLPPWCNYLPSNGFSSSLDTYQLWSSMAYGNELTDDPLFLSRSSTMLGGGGNLLGKLQSQGTNNISNRAALLALVQIQNGVL